MVGFTGMYDITFEYAVKIFDQSINRKRDQQLPWDSAAGFI